MIEASQFITTHCCEIERLSIKKSAPKTRKIQIKTNATAAHTTTTVWADYERIQGDIFDYLLAVLPEFGLSLYQQPSGNDMRVGLAGRVPRRLEELSEA